MKNHGFPTLGRPSSRGRALKLAARGTIRVLLEVGFISVGRHGRRHVAKHKVSLDVRWLWLALRDVRG